MPLRLCVRSLILSCFTLFIYGCSSIGTVSLNEGGKGDVVRAPTHSSSIVMSSTAWQKAGNIPMNQVDSGRATFYEIEALSQGKASEYNWVGQQAFGKVIAASPFKINNVNCMDLHHEITMNGKKYTGVGTACETTAGKWDIVS